MSGNLEVKSASLVAATAFSLANSFNFSGVVPLGTVTSPLALGRTVTGTVTSSVISVPFIVWVTVVGIVNPSCPAFPSVLKISLAFG